MPMKKLFFLLLFAGLIHSAKADTIDFWHVYKNGIKVKELNGFGKNELVISQQLIQTGDTLTVRYFRDTPCSDCPTTLTVEDEKHRIITSGSGKGTFKPVSFPLRDVLAFSTATGKKTFDIYYKEGDANSRWEKMLLFSIRLE
jgi:hypothetical protein